jgi:hypothetical protein
MDALLARYFDGDLPESEAAEFLGAVESDPRLEQELRAYERVLSIGKALAAPRVPARFTERVMESVVADRRPGRMRMRPTVVHTRWLAFAAVAASVIIAFLGGFWAGYGRGWARRGKAGNWGRGGGECAVHITRAQGVAAEGMGLRYVRLVYVPRSQRGGERCGELQLWNPATTGFFSGKATWSTIVVLAPGSAEYMFIENGERWVTDPLAARTREDGFGARTLFSTWNRDVTVRGSIRGGEMSVKWSRGEGERDESPAGGRSVDLAILERSHDRPRSRIDGWPSGAPRVER